MVDTPDDPVLPPLLVISTHPIGGVGKSLVANVVADAGYRSGLDLHIFENDGQRFFDPYGSVFHIPLPSTEAVVHDPILDIRVHSDFNKTLIGAKQNYLGIYDGAAASLNRHSYMVDQLDIGLRVEAMGRYVLVFVVTSSREDVAREAIVAYGVWRELLPPPHRIVPVISQRDGNVDELPEGHDLHKLVKMSDEEPFLLPRVPMTLINDMRRSGIRLCDLADIRNPLETPEMARKMGMDATIVQMMRRNAGYLLAETDEYMRRLGFTLGL